VRVVAIALFCLPACEPWGPRTESEDTSAIADDEALVLSPALLDLGRVRVGQDAPVVAEFTVQNVGPTARTVHGHDEAVTLAGPDDVAFQIDSEEPFFTLQPGESRTFSAVFDPPGDGDWVSEIRLNYGIEVLRLRGSGQAPVLQVTSPYIPSVPIGCSESFDVRVENTGRERLRIESPALVDGVDFSLAVALPALAVAPGGGVDLRLRFGPGWQAPADSTRTARLMLPTNDPQQGEVGLPLQAFAWAGSEVVETFSFHARSQADVLFVADTDGVMSAHVDKAQAAIGDFLGALDEANVSLHAAVVTGASACPSTSPRWVGDDAPLWQRETVLQDGFEGLSGPDAERLLALAVAALEQDVPGGCLEGFRREGAALHVVVVSGGPDEGGLAPGDALAALAAVHPNAREVVVSSVIATESTGCGGAAYGEGYAEAAVGSGGEIVDLCEADWTTGFERVAARSHAGVDGGLSLPLVDGVLLESVSVNVDGASWTNWEHDAEAGALVFPAETAPEPGSDVRVRYRLGVDCD